MKLQIYHLSFLVFFLVMVVFKTCSFISQHLLCYSQRRTRQRLLLVGNQKWYIVLFFLPNILFFCIASSFLNKKFDRDPQNNYTTKTVNVYDLDTRLKIHLKKIILKNCLFCATNIVKE